MKTTSKQIKTIAQLNEVLSGEEMREFAIQLNGGCFSRKEMMRDGKKYIINNCIDDSEQVLTEKQLLNERYTNIGKAMKMGAFYQLI